MWGIFFFLSGGGGGGGLERGEFYVCLGNSQTTGLKNFWSYPITTLYIHYSKYYLMISSDGTDESSEWQVCLSESSLLSPINILL